MANDTRASGKAKDEESSDTKGKNASGKSSTSSGAVTPDAAIPRRSTREASSKTNTTPSPSKTRKSERLGKRTTTTPPANRKYERVEKQSLHSPLRRSERAKMQSSSSSSGSKRSDKSVGSSSTNKKQKKEKSVKELNFETNEVGKNEKQVEIKRMDARTYRALFRCNPKKATVAGRSEAVVTRDKLSQGCRSKKDDMRNECGQSNVAELRGEDTVAHLENKSKKYNSDLKRTYEVLPSKRKRNTADTDSDATCNKDNTYADAVRSYICKRNGFVGTCAACFKRRRIYHDSEQQELCSCKTQNQDLGCISLAKDRGKTGAAATTGFAEQCITSLHKKESPVDFQADRNLDMCLVCKQGGTLLCCDGRGCGRSYHLLCLNPPFDDVPLGIWHCPSCVKKKLEFGVHSVSEGIESIWDVREVDLSGDQGMRKQKQFLVKYKGLSHAHNVWVPETQLLLEAPTLLAKFNRKNQVTRWKLDWALPHHFLQKRLLTSPKQPDKCHGGNSGDIVDSQYEWLVKWRGLDYEHATWEFESASFMNSPEARRLITDYENRHEKGSKRTQFLHSVDEKLEYGKNSPMRLSTGVSPGLDYNHLDFVNNLRDCWQRRQNAVIIDDQERIMKVISFISSLSSSISLPVLIVTTSSALYLWDEELFRIAPSVYAVIYHGNRDVRKSIQTSEFYNEAGCIMFQMLLTSPKIVIEDVNVFKSIKWEAIIIDESQRDGMHSCFEQIKSLTTCMRLLLANGQLKDGITEQLLSLLDCQSDLNGGEDLLTNSSHKIGNLKDRLLRYVANGSKPESSRYTEYWVPVQISDMQLEQYCATLLSNSLSLCTSSKNDPVGALRDMLISARKCCDHPYILDPSLQISLTKEGKVVDILDVGIKASGKLLLLDAMLVEMKNRGLRVLILFQSSGGSGKDNIGDILDDFVRQRFGQDSFERIDGGINRSRKQSALNNFNGQKGRFVFLLETRACLSSIKLSSVDTVIIFGSDWSPVNDIRNLQKITLDSQFEQIKIFRLYSSYTVEEKVLILARHDKNLDSNLQSISRSTIPTLLMWGAAYLFSKLSEFHRGSAPVCSESDLERGLLNDVIQEFLTILGDSDKDNHTGNSKILKVMRSQGTYNSGSPLLGELEIQLVDEEPPHIFWKKLLEGKQPRWKYLSGSSQRNRKRFSHFDDSLNKPKDEGDESAKKCNKLADNSIDPPPLEPPLVGTFGTPAHDTSSGSTCLPNTKAVDHTPTSPLLAINLSEELGPNTAMLCERTNLHGSQKSLHLLLKPEIAKLCAILQLPENVKDMVELFLAYVMNNHRVVKEPATILQAFQISLCWTAASLLKHKLDHKESLAVAKQLLNFSCKKEEADFVYSMLRCLKSIFLCHIGNLNLTGSPTGSQLSAEDHSESYLHSRSLQTMPGHVSTDYRVPPQLGLAVKDLSKSIKDIEKKCHKQMNKLLQRHQAEKQDFNRKYIEEKAHLEHKQKTEAAVIRLHSNSSMRTDKLKLLDIEYAKKFEELKCQMEMRRKNLVATQFAARNKLCDREAHWVKEVRSWAHVELINKLSSVETVQNHENAIPSSACFKGQIPKKPQSMQHEEVPLEVPETISTNEDREEVLPGLQITSEQITDGISSTKSGGDVTLRVPKNASFKGYSVDSVPMNPFSFRERIPDVEFKTGMLATTSSNDGVDFTVNKPLSEGPSLNGVGFKVTDGDSPMGTPGVASSNILEDVVSINRLESGATSCMQGEILSEMPETGHCEALSGNTIGERKGVYSMASGNATRVEVHDEAVCINQVSHSDKTAVVNLQNGEDPSGMAEAPGELVEGFNNDRLLDVDIQADKNVGDEDAQSPVKSARLDQHDGEVSSTSLETAPGIVVDGNSGKCQDGEVLADKTVDNEDSECSDETAIVHEKDGEVPSRVPETVPGAVVEGGSAGKIVHNQDSQSSDENAQVKKQGAEVPAKVAETASDLLVEGSSINKSVDVEDCRSPDKTTRVNEQDIEVPAKVPETAPDVLVVGDSTGGESSGACVMAASCGAIVDQQGELIAAAVSETACGAVSGSSTGIPPDEGASEFDVVSMGGLGAHSQELSSVNLPSIQSVTALARGSPTLLNQALQVQDECPVPTVSSGLQDGGAQVNENQNALQQLERSGAQSNAISDQSNNEPVIEHVLPIGGSGMRVSGTRTMPITSMSAGHASPMQRPPASGSSPAETVPPLQMPQPSFQDPLQYELERIRKETDKTTSTHENAKLQLKWECDNEIKEVVAQIRRKYEIKLQDLESEFLLKKKELDANQNKVLMNKILAEAFKSKCMDFRASAVPGKQQEVASSFMQQLLHLSAPPMTHRSSIIAGLSFPGPPATLQTTTTSGLPAASPHGTSPSLQAVHRSSLFSGTSTRPTPQISSISPTTSNLQLGSEIRAPAPHLQAFRPPASMPAAGLSSLSRGLPSSQVPSPSTTSPILSSGLSSHLDGLPSPQVPSDPYTTSPIDSGLSPHSLAFSSPQAPTNPSTTSPILSRLPSQLPTSIPHLHETAGGLHPHTMSALELLMEVEDQRNTNPIQPGCLSPQIDLGSNSDTLDRPEHIPLNGARGNPVCPTVVVCLSDDD